MCEDIANEKGYFFNDFVNNELNPPGCFIHYGNNPPRIYYNSSLNHEFDCDDTKTCICEKGNFHNFFFELYLLITII